MVVKPPYGPLLHLGEESPDSRKYRNSLFNMGVTFFNYSMGINTMLCKDLSLMGNKMQGDFASEKYTYKRPRFKINKYSM
jgi:hypothetical protein